MDSGEKRKRREEGLRTGSEGASRVQRKPLVIRFGKVPSQLKSRTAEILEALKRSKRKVST